MQNQELSYNYIYNIIKDSGLKVISIPLCDSIDLYSYVIYDYKFKDILYILKCIYNINNFGERKIMDKYCDDDSLDYILHSEINIPAIAIINAESFKMEVEKTLTDLSASKYFSLYQDILLTLTECMNKLEAKKYELQEEYDELENTYKRIKNTVHPAVELMKIYKERLKELPFYKFKEKRKWKHALEYLRASEDKVNIINNELTNINAKIKSNIESQQDCGEEYLSLSSCHDYLTEYISSRRVVYMDLLSNMVKYYGGNV